jgi:circadian clock protein KaiB
MEESNVHLSETWYFKVYVAGESEKSRNAIVTLKHVCKAHIKDPCDIEVVDLRKHPELAAKKEIFAIPTVVKELPPPVRKLIGDLTVKEKVLLGLEIYKK